MKREGWLKLWRSLQSHWLWKITPFSPGQAWIDLLIRANWRRSKLVDPGRMIATTVKKGEIFCSIRNLAEDWGWSRTRARRFLRMLADDSMIETTNETTHTRLKLLNWNTYQGSGTEKEPLTSHEKSHKKTTEGPRKSHRRAQPRATSKKTQKTKKTTPLPPEVVEELIALFNGPETRRAVCEFINFRSGECNVAGEDIRAEVTTLVNLRASLNADDGLPHEELFRYAIDETVRRGGRSVQYTETVLANAIKDWRDGAFKL